jgi:hypothetical protein
MDLQLLGLSSFYALDVGLGFATTPKDLLKAVIDLFLCPRCRAGLCNAALIEARVERALVSMLSMSGWALQPRTTRCRPAATGFLCPRCRAGLCNMPEMIYLQESGFYALDVGLGFATAMLFVGSASAAFLCPRCRAGLCNGCFRRDVLDFLRSVSMPSMSGWALQRVTAIASPQVHHSQEFLCPRCRAGLCNMSDCSWCGCANRFLCPRCRAGLCNLIAADAATTTDSMFLCPRCRAGLCNTRLSDMTRTRSVSMPSMSGWALQPDGCTAARVTTTVSMPSMSGWALQRSRSHLLTHPRSAFLCPRCRAGLCNITAGLLALTMGLMFLCPRCRAGLCNATTPDASHAIRRFLCPRCRAGLCNRNANGVTPGHKWFLCPRCRAGLCNSWRRSCLWRTSHVSMPSMSGWALQLHYVIEPAGLTVKSFYALDVGLGFATDAL